MFSKYDRMSSFSTLPSRPLPFTLVKSIVLSAAILLTAGVANTLEWVPEGVWSCSMGVVVVGVAQIMYINSLCCLGGAVGVTGAWSYPSPSTRIITNGSSFVAVASTSYINCSTTPSCGQYMVAED